ncbi:MAG: hypothetical protein Q4B54_13465 [Coriobacteriales bacterium]|nr:hypothetical protein [Coriobacteriales bacterium]
MNDNLCTHAADKIVRGRQRRPDEASLARRGSALFSMPTLAGARLTGTRHAHTGGTHVAGTPLPSLANGRDNSPQPREPMAA